MTASTIPLRAALYLRVCAVYAATISAAIARASRPIGGRMTSGCPTSSRGLSARPVAGARLTSGRIGTRWNRRFGY